MFRRMVEWKQGTGHTNCTIHWCTHTHIHNYYNWQWSFASILVMGDCIANAMFVVTPVYPAANCTLIVYTSATAGTNGANEKSKQAAAVDDRSDHNRRRRRSSADVREVISCMMKWSIYSLYQRTIWLFEGNRTQIYKRERSPDMKRRWRHDDKRSNEAHSRHRHRESSDRRRRSRSRDGRSGGRRWQWSSSKITGNVWLHWS